MSLDSMKPLGLLLFVISLSATSFPPAPAPARASTRHAQIELLSQTRGVSANQPLWLGVRFLLEKGWHIYWVNPGDSGQPPVLHWKLPPGFSPGEIGWPRPELIRNSQIADYGYDGDILLLVPVRVPAQLSTNPAEIAVEINWLICREVCLPEHTFLQRSLPVLDRAVPDPIAARLIADAKRLLPRPWPRNWTVRADSRRGSFLLTVDTGHAVRDVHFFPLIPDQVENSAPQAVEPLARGARLTLRKSDLLMQPVRVLQGVLVVGGNDSFRIAVPVSGRTDAVLRY